MSVLPVGLGSSGVDTGDIGHSLRFRSAASAYLNRTITTATTSTYFAAVKRGKLGAISPIFDINIKFNANDTLTAFGLTTTAVFRDPTSWLFIHVSNGGLYINGVSFGAVTTSAITNPRIGFDGTNYFDGHMARVGVVDGNSTYSNFGYLNAEINEWVSKSQSAVKAVVDAGGTNSFMLDFDDATNLTTLGYDKSSKGNHWTLNNFSLTAGVNYDHMLDVPGNSFATLSPLKTNFTIAGAGTLSSGNLVATLTGSNNLTVVASLISGGATYSEHKLSSVGGNYPFVGIIPSDSNVEGTVNCGVATFSSYWYGNGNIAANDLIGLAHDPIDATLAVYKNNTQVANFTSIPANYNALAVSGTAGAAWESNFGQRPFIYTPPAGFSTLCQRNLPDPAILNPEKHMDAVTQLGSAVNTGANLLAQFTNFTAGLAWGKDRAAVNNHQLVDTVRGSTAVLQSNTTAAETTYTAPTAGDNCVAWGWKMGGAAVTNNAGSTSSQVSANVTAGQAIVTYTGTGANATVGHGLGVQPKMVIVKQRNGATNWAVNHQAYWGVGTGVTYLNLTNAKSDDATFWNSTNPTSSLIYLGSNASINGNAQTHVAYCFAEIPGYSKIFSYTGNSSTDGPFVHCGFKPKFVLIKCATLSGAGQSDWHIIDAARNPYNVTNLSLWADSSNAEYTATNELLDVTSSGIKLRGSSNVTNSSGRTYIGIAFADVAGKYSLGR